MIQSPKIGKTQDPPKPSDGKLKIPEKTDQKNAGGKATERLHKSDNTQTKDLTNVLNTLNSNPGSKVVTVRDSLGDLVIIVLDSNGNVISTTVVSISSGFNPFLNAFKPLPKYERQLAVVRANYGKICFNPPDPPYPCSISI